MSARGGLLALLAGVTLLLGSCDSPSARCTEDAACDVTGEGLLACNLDDGFCVCIDDRACGPNEFCNALGRCQTVSGCSTNDDCGTNDAGLFCDITSAQCLSLQECSPAEGQSCCSLDSQCPFREICDTLTLTCVAGCRDNGDCILGEGCVGAGFGRLGQCGRACTDNNLCRAGELCNITEGLCARDTRGPYCQGCAGGVQSDDCGDFGNYCLVDTVNGGEFCGVDCRVGEECPQGYSCSQVIILPPSAPTCTFAEICQVPQGAASGSCSRTAGACARDEDCPEGPPGGNCFERTNGRYGSCTGNPNINCQSDPDCGEGGGSCVRIECRGSEGDNIGHCSCTRDADCPADSCIGADQSNPQIPVAGHCELSQRDCFEDFECDTISCVGGGCLIGSNCAPSNDRSCADLQPAESLPSP